MAWPDDYTTGVNNIASVVWREILSEELNLITEQDDGILRVAGMRGSIQPMAGGDKFNINAMISSGETETEYDPAAVDPSTTVGISGFQYLAPAEYKYYARTKNIIFPQDLAEMTTSPRRVADIFRIAYMANIKGMVENMVNANTSPGGFWYVHAATGSTAQLASMVLPQSEGMTNAYSIAVAQTNEDGFDFAGIDVSDSTNGGDKWIPTRVAASDSAGANLLRSDLQSLLNGCQRPGEGGVTDIFTTQTVWEKIRSLMIHDGTAAAGILGLSDIKANLGFMNTIQYGPAKIHWNRFLAAASVYDNTAGNDLTAPLIGFDMNSLKLRIRTAGGVPGDEFGLFRRLNPLQLSETRIKFFQRIGFIGQWALTTSRRTSGYLDGLDADAIVT